MEHSPTSRHRAVGAALAVILLAASACSVAIPPPGSAAEQREIEQGAEYDKVITEQYGVYEDEQLAAYVDRVGQAVAARSEWPTLPWTFRVLDSSMVNAFAIPGGYIYVTRGLLGHMNSEAELAGVLGHEVGHVTGRHAAEAQRRAMFASAGILLGAVVSEQFVDYGLRSGLAQAAVGLTLLRYSRSQELESDERGIGYAVAAGYNPSGIGAFFATLQALEQQRGGRGVPGWASTHPEVDDRIERSSQWAAETVARLDVRLSDLVVNRREHVQRVDGIVFGDDPRDGYFDGRVLLHPAMRFRLELPDGWDALNTRAAVRALAPDEDAIVQLTLARLEPDEDRERYIGDYLTELGAQVVGRDDREINGNWSRQVRFTVSGQSANYEVLGTWIWYRANMYQLLGITTPSRYSRYDDRFVESFRSFDELRDRRALAVQPSRLEIVTPPRPMLLAELMERTPELSDERGTVAIINAIQPDSRVTPDELVKLIEGTGFLLPTSSNRDRR
jgi:predicted Zn-dependent protease